MVDGKDQKCLAADYEELKAKYMLLQREWQCNQETLGQLLTDETDLQSALKRQAEFCSEVGSTFGVFLGEATRSPEFIDTIWRQKDKIEDLLQVIIGGLTSFNNTYYSYTSIAKTPETRFIKSMLKMVANLSTVDDGQRYFLTTDSGNTLIQLIIKIVHRLPSPSGNALKK
ncbi:Hypothetical protein CINCED_3A011431 [Cinara cedri]|uniref:Uncharacterized protein n=1 Tax=Cinara cedri TaxID=506608 RepID=A0A5E4MZT0_9HEMI|nr:Hypothetical protein CINCED_3A011431 [Cinara cedri]